jgi:hypothetical protein
MFDLVANDGHVLEQKIPVLRACFSVAQNVRIDKHVNIPKTTRIEGGSLEWKLKISERNSR